MLTLPFVRLPTCRVVTSFVVCLVRSGAVGQPVGVRLRERGRLQGLSLLPVLQAGHRRHSRVRPPPGTRSCSSCAVLLTFVGFPLRV